MSPRTYYAISRAILWVDRIVTRLYQWHTSANWARVRK